MKISEQPTTHILVRAGTDSEWDKCDFAIIDCGKEWTERISKRIAAVGHIPDDGSFFSARWRDSSVSFYVSQEQETTELPPQGWAFVELEEDEEESFNAPENSLTLYALVLYKNGGGQYTAHSKHSGEEFYTEDLPFATIIESIINENLPI